MTHIERQVRTVQRRLWVNCWYEQTCWALTVGAAVFGAVVLFDRLYGAEWPLWPISLILLAMAVLAGTLRSYLLRASRQVAAAALDEAAGLRERVSTGLYCQDDGGQQADPFARAVVADAERVSGSLSARMHIRMKAPFAAVYAGMAMSAAALLLLLPSGLLAGDDEQQAAAESEQVTQAKVVVQRRLDEVKKLAQTNPAMKDLKDAFERLDQKPESGLQKPEQVRHEAIKKIDKLSDSLREQRRGDKFHKAQQFKKMMRRIKAPGEAKTSVQKLTQSLAKGDMKAAQEQIQEMQENLAKLKSPQDAEKLKLMQKQLEDLAKKISQAADDKQLEQKLQQAGIKKEDIERMLQKLTKQDLDQLKQQLQQMGMKQQDIEKLAQQLQKRQQACQACKQMAQAMQQAASAAAQGDGQQAAEGLQGAGDQLSEMEMLEQEMNQLDSMMAELDDAKNDLDNTCSNCQGGGCNKCGGTGQGRGGMGPKPGRGRGSLAPEQQTGTGFEKRRQKVETTPGKIIGQFLVDGEQAKGEVSSELAETVMAAERDATDLVHRNDIPRQYQKSVMDYFSSMRREIGRALPTPVEGGEPADGTDTEGEAAADSGQADEDSD